MKKLRTKQAVICFIGVAVCKLGFAGCYPFIPAYFAAAYLERGGRLLLGIGMFLGMAFMLPLPLMTKYVMTLLVTIVIIKLAEWVKKLKRHKEEQLEKLRNIEKCDFEFKF